MKSALLPVFSLATLSFSSASAQVSRFDNNSEKWSANEDAVGHVVHFDPSMGNPPPSIFADDSDTGKPWYFVAPDCFRGNRAYAYGDTLQFDFFTKTVGQTSYTNDVILRGANGMTLIRNHGKNPTPGAWTHFAVPLLENQWFINNANGPNPTLTQFLDVLTDIAELEIRGEYLTGVDRSWIDNVWLGQVPDTSITAAICPGQTIKIGKYEHSTPGLFLDELEDKNGCDSLLVRLDLTVKPNVNTLLQAGFCAGETYTLPDGTSTQTGGFFPFKYTASNGCDSNLLLQVTRWQNDTTRLSPSLCRGETYTLPDGQATTQEGTYLFDFQNVRGCDSTVVVRLLVGDTAWSGSSARICRGDFFAMPDGSQAAAPGHYEFKFQTLKGCDSTVVVSLAVADTFFKIQKFDRCFGDPFRLPDGSLAEAPGLFKFVFQNQLGCDSTELFDLRFHPIFDTLLVVQLPEGTPYVLPDGSRVVDTTLEKIYRFSTPFGCDSTVALRLDYVFYKVFIPNVISPNDDGRNDFFTVFTNDDARQVNLLRVFDRWGELVFEKYNFEPSVEPLGWDGKYRDRAALPGVFAWVAELEFSDGHRVFLKGDVTVVRE